MYCNPDLYAAGGWLRGGILLFDFGIDYIGFTEKLGGGEFDTLGFLTLRSGIVFPKTDFISIYWDGLYSANSEGEDSAAGFGIMTEIRIVDPLYFEFHADVAAYPRHLLWDLGAYLKVRKYVGLKIGYRALIAGDQTLHGPEIGLMFEF